MPSLREALNAKPWLGWGVAAVLAVIAGVVFVRSLRSGDTYSVDRMTEEVTIKCAETGETWTMPRGRMEKELRLRSGLLDASQGLTNPNTGRPTGFPFDAGSWDETIRRINAEKQALIRSRGGPPAPPP